MRRALYTSADPMKGEPVAGQGNGMLDVNGAWSLLAKRFSTARYESSAPVCTALAEFLDTPNRGVGIHNRCVAGEGGEAPARPRLQGADQADQRVVPTVRHKLTWLGDKSRFRSVSSVSLPLNKAVTVPVTVTAQDGLNSAILRVDDPATSVVEFEILNTVVTSTQVKKPSYTLTGEGSVERNSTRSYFVVVPEGATSLQVDLTGIATGSHTRWIAYNPYGVPMENTSSLNCYTNFSDAAACKPQERSYNDPLPAPGSWRWRPAGPRRRWTTRTACWPRCRASR